MKKWIKTYLCSLRKDIVILLILDCLFLLLMELVLRRIPAPFPIFVKVGNVCVTLGISFLASFIFFFVQVHLPETRQRIDIYPSIAALFSRIIHRERSLVLNFAGVKSDEDFSDEDLRNGVDARDVNKQDAPMTLVGLDRNANWMEYGFSYVKDIDVDWDMIMRYSSFLDSEFLSLLSHIQSNGTLGFFRTMKGVYPALKQGLKLNGFGTGWVELWHFIQEQEEYYNRVFAEYKQ